MSSFQSKAINFMTNRPITVRDLSSLSLIPTGQSAFPFQFHEMGWATWLPISCITLLPFFSDGIAKDMKEEDLLCYLKEKVKPDTFPLNDQQLGTSEPDNFYNREGKIRRRLELNGFRYPQCVENVVELYVHVGLSKKIIEHTSGDTLYDLVIRPLRHVDSVLTKTTEQLDK